MYPHYDFQIDSTRYWNVVEVADRKSMNGYQEMEPLKYSPQWKCFWESIASKLAIRKNATITTFQSFELRYEFLELIPLESASQRLELHDALYFERFLFQLLNEFYALLRFCFFISAATDYNCLM